MVQGGGAICVQEADLVSVRDPAVRVHAPEVDAISVSVIRDREHRREHRQAVAARKKSEVVGEHPAGDVRCRCEVGAHGRVPGRDRRSLGRVEIVRARERDIGDHCGVRVVVETIRTDEPDVVDARRRRRVVTWHVPAGHTARRDGVRPQQLLGAAGDPTLVGRCAHRRALGVAAEAPHRGHDLVADRTRDHARVVDKDVAGALGDRAGAEHQDFAGVHEHLQQRPPDEQPSPVAARAPFGVGAVARRAAGPEVRRPGGQRGLRANADQDQRSERGRAGSDRQRPIQGPH